jgi:hypothetical protein
MISLFFRYVILGLISITLLACGGLEGLGSKDNANYGDGVTVKLKVGQVATGDAATARAVSQFAPLTSDVHRLASGGPDGEFISPHRTGDANLLGMRIKVRRVAVGESEVANFEEDGGRELEIGAGYQGPLEVDGLVRPGEVRDYEVQLYNEMAIKAYAYLTTAAIVEVPPYYEGQWVMSANTVFTTSDGVEVLAGIVSLSDLEAHHGLDYTQFGYIFPSDTDEFVTIRREIPPLVIPGADDQAAEAVTGESGAAVDLQVLISVDNLVEGVLPRRHPHDGTLIESCVDSDTPHYDPSCEGTFRVNEMPLFLAVNDPGIFTGELYLLSRLDLSYEMPPPERDPTVDELVWYNLATTQQTELVELFRGHPWQPIEGWSGAFDLNRVDRTSFQYFYVVYSSDGVPVDSVRLSRPERNINNVLRHPTSSKFEDEGNGTYRFWNGRFNSDDGSISEALLIENFKQLEVGELHEATMTLGPDSELEIEEGTAFPDKHYAGPLYVLRMK